MKETDIQKSNAIMSTNIRVFIIMQLQFEYFKYSEQSIAGVTYMDHFDFEERYRDVTECDPLYWHPLHLPLHCMDMFMKLIRSKMAKDFPVRIVTKKDNNYYGLSNFGYSQPVYQIDTGISNEYEEPQSPFRQMMNLLQHDVQRQPAVPKYEILPYFGLSAVYNQPISSKSENLINIIGNTYSKYTAINDGYYLGKVEIKKTGGNDKSSQNNINPSDLENERKFVLDTLNQDRSLRITKKLKNGDTLIITKKEINSL